jgi:hypothetical protein
VQDILQHLIAERGSAHLAFLSHHKEVGRSGRAPSMALFASMRTSPQPSAEALTSRSASPTSTRPHLQDAGDGARIFVDTTRRLISTAAGDRLKATGVFEGMAPESLIFLDSTGLKDLANLLDDVAASSNYVLLLSRKVLERPWVLAELACAHKLGKNMCVVLVEYPGRHEDPKAFRFPQDLEKAIADWREFRASEAKYEDKSKRRLLKRNKKKTAKDSTSSLSDVDPRACPAWASSVDSSSGALRA